MPSDFDKQIQEELEKIKSDGLYKKTLPISSLQGAEVEIEGKKIVNFCANNYLGLAGSEELIKSGKESLDKYGFGMASVRFISGTSTVHLELEQTVAKFFGFDNAILYSSCFDANGGLFETITNEQDTIFSDELNHASIIDGIRLSKAVRERYSHSNTTELEDKLKLAKDRRRRVIVTDGVFSMDGEVAKLRELSDLAQKYDALLVVDDSHGSGVLGSTGRGSIEGVKIDILTSTFGKALGGAAGGFVAGANSVIELLRQRSRPYLFSNTLVPAVAGAALYVLENFDTKFQPLRRKLIENTNYLRGALEKANFKLGGDGTHPIIPVYVGDEAQTAQMAEKLYKEGIYVRGFTYPVVPRGKARIRVQVSAAHSQAHLDKLVRAMVNCRS